MNKMGLLVTSGVVVAVVAGLGIWLATSPVNAPTGSVSSPAAGTDRQVKSPHFLDSTPLHGEVYAAQPINVTLNFNFDLAVGSAITVQSTDGREWQDGTAAIEDAQTALKVPLKQGMSDGQYQVMYTACWPDKSCHDGQFSFSIDSSKQAEYQDQRGQKAITIHMKDIAFQQPKLI